MRENIYSKFAEAINRFSRHEITKKDMLLMFADLVHMADNAEKNELSKYIKIEAEWEALSFEEKMNKEKPHSDLAYSLEKVNQ